MVSFYPGPSKLHPEVKNLVNQAIDTGLLSVNHRSDIFMEMMAETKKSISTYLNLPEGYQIVFTSSATECWEIIPKSLVKGLAMHIFNGSFGEKWFQFAYKIKRGSEDYIYKLQEPLPVDELLLPLMTEVVCITQNETSNGTQVAPSIFSYLRKQSPGTLIAVDATSSMAGIELPYSDADVWLASVQKCFGLPSGLGIMILSPKAIERSNEINERERYNSLSPMLEFSSQNQTPYTPNVLGIFLIGKVCSLLGDQKIQSDKVKSRAARIYDFLEGSNQLRPLIHNKAVRSDTVVAVKTSPEMIKNCRKLAENNGILLGKGYGKWVDETFRIANFPAHTDAEIEELIGLLKQIDH
jgi:phosphoserine aminotransferase